MTIMQMECFVEAARCGSFTKAGENLYISQQTMSRHIRTLETELGFPLFERKNTGAVLTRAGECLFQNWGELLRLYRTSIDQAKDLYYGQQKKLRIGILDNFGIYIDELVESLMRFERRYRDLEMEYEVLSMKQLLHGLETDRLQMIIVYTAELEKVSGIYCRRLDNTAASTGIYCALSHPLVKKKNHTWEDLYGQTIGILSDEASLDNKERTLEFLKKNGLENRVQLQEYSSRQNLGVALLTGKCVTISYSSMFESLAGKLACYPLAKEEGNPEVSIAWRDEKYATKAQNISRMFENVNHRPE